MSGWLQFRCGKTVRETVRPPDRGLGRIHRSTNGCRERMDQLDEGRCRFGS